MRNKLAGSNLHPSYPDMIKRLFGLLHFKRITVNIHYSLSGIYKGRNIVSFSAVSDFRAHFRMICILLTLLNIGGREGEEIMSLIKYDTNLGLPFLQFVSETMTPQITNDLALLMNFLSQDSCWQINLCTYLKFPLRHIVPKCFSNESLNCYNELYNQLFRFYWWWSHFISL